MRERRSIARHLGDNEYQEQSYAVRCTNTACQARVEYERKSAELLFSGSCRIIWDIRNILQLVLFAYGFVIVDH